LNGQCSPYPYRMSKVIKAAGLVILATVYFPLLAQIDTVRIYVNGLTCSSCSKAVEEKLVQVSFVKSVRMNLNYNEATVLVDFSKEIDWDILAKAVYDAGFSVGSFFVPACEKGNYLLNGLSCMDNYFYVGNDKRSASTLQYALVGKKFMDKKTYAFWKNKIPVPAPNFPTSTKHYYYY